MAAKHNSTGALALAEPEPEPEPRTRTRTPDPTPNPNPKPKPNPNLSLIKPTRSTPVGRSPISSSVCPTPTSSQCCWTTATAFRPRSAGSTFVAFTRDLGAGSALRLTGCGGGRSAKVAHSPTAAVRQLAARTRDLSAHFAYALCCSRVSLGPLMAQRSTTTLSAVRGRSCSVTTRALAMLRLLRTA